MKILTFLTNIDQTKGGPSRSVPMFVRGLALEGVDVTLMVIKSNDMNLHALEGTSAKLKVWNSAPSVKEMKDFILSEKFDIIQLQSMWAMSYHQVARIARKHNIPYIITPRGMLEPWSLRQKTIKKKLAMMLYQKNDLDKAACIYTTAGMEAFNVHNLGIKAPCSVIPNGIETDGYPCRSNHGIVKKQILFLSRIHVKKGIEMLIDAWKILANEFPEWKIKIVGNGEKDYIYQLKTKISKAGLEGCIQILPPVFGQDKVDLYQSSALFVLPSYSENFGMVIAEAMSCGVPVITSEFTPWDFLNKEKAGWWIKLNLEDLVKTLRESLNKPCNELYQMGQNGAKLVRNRYDYRSVAKQTLNLYEWLLGNRNKPEFVDMYR